MTELNTNSNGDFILEFGDENEYHCFIIHKNKLLGNEEHFWFLNKLKDFCDKHTNPLLDKYK